MSDIAGTDMLPVDQSDLSQQGGTITRNILGVDVQVLDGSQAIDEVERAVAAGSHKKIAFLNAHGANIAYQDHDYQAVLDKFTVLADGIGVDIGSKMLYREPFPENLNGTDFIPRLFSEISSPLKVGLFGAGKDVAIHAVRMLSEQFPNHAFEMIGDGYFETADEEQVIKKLQADPPDVLLVALGNPIQEKWIAKNCTGHHARVAIGVGALFDFTSGRVRRAPEWMISLRIEWLFRLLLEPGRMWRRYVLGNPLFLIRILKQKLFGSSGQKRPR